MSLRERTRTLLTHRLAHGQVEGRLPSVVAGLVRGGELVWSGGRGEVGGREPDADTQYRIGSISKTLTALLVLQLRDAGRLDLADPLEAHLPGTPVGDRTLAQLLSHSAGLQAETAGAWWERTPGGDLHALVGELGPDAVQRRGGRRFHYSNLGYGLLGGVVESLHGRPWGDCLQTEVLAPLGMSRTTLRPRAPHASGFAVHPFADVLLAEPEHDAGAMAPAGQVWSTVADLARLAGALAGDGAGVVRAETVAEMAEALVLDEPAVGGPGPAPAPAAGYGLGLQVLWHGERRLVGHGGSMPGFLAGLEVERASGDGVVLLANATTGLPATLGRGLLDCLATEEPLLPRAWRPTAADPEALELVGPWFWGPSALVLRLGPDGLLHLAAMQGRARPSRFRPAGDGTWRGLDGYYADEVLRVVRADDGGVRHLDLATFVLTRTPYDPAAGVPGGVDPHGWR